MERGTQKIAYFSYLHTLWLATPSFHNTLQFFTLFIVEKYQNKQKIMKPFILSNLLMKFLAINIKLFGVL